jgi:hypothetical protein
MNRDYSKVFESLNQDAEKERNKKAEKAVHDNLYNKGFRDGLAVLDKIRAEIEKTTSRYTISRERGAMGQVEWSDRLIKESEVLEIINKYKAESEVI